MIRSPVHASANEKSGFGIQPEPLFDFHAESWQVVVAVTLPLKPKRSPFSSVSPAKRLRCSDENIGTIDSSVCRFTEQPRNVRDRLAIGLSRLTPNQDSRCRTHRFVLTPFRPNGSTLNRERRESQLAT